MKTSWVFCGVVFISTVLITASWQQEEDEKVLLDNKCQCVKVTSKFVPSKDNYQEKVLERNIRIIVPLTARENISDPTSPGRTKFVYKLSKLCNKCTSVENTKQITTGPSSLCDDPEEPCYTYDRNKCYTAACLFSNNGKTEPIKTALTPESCYLD